MDPVREILFNCCNMLGFQGVRNLKDLGIMKQATLEKKLRKNGQRLESNSIASIYMAWMAEHIAKSPSWEEGTPAWKMCMYLKDSGCGGIDAVRIWNDMLLLARMGSRLQKPESERLHDRGRLVEKVIIVVLLPTSDLRDVAKEVGEDHCTADCPFLSKSKIAERTPPGYVCKNCGSIRHFDYACPRNNVENLQKSQDTTAMKEDQSENAYWAESAYGEQRSALETRDSPELQYGDHCPETSKDRSIIWKESTPFDGRLTPWSEDDVSQDQTVNNLGRQETSEDRISLQEADDFLTEMGKEIQEATLPVSNVEGSSLSGARHGRALDGSPPRKMQKRQHPVDEMSMCDEAKSSVEVHRTPKSLDRDPPHHDGVISLFHHRENVLVNRVRRSSAADMWPESTERVDGQE
ncbi:unnamed protein product [Clonostachys solani]|uniref:Zinc knuckle CX2CX3GHX4C domain-containing protein n=1 Tax=Clonostachys solani TaxID=160281 RepID=A0A9N9Z480_9HYPO|nr:unnamed protein product [Clonostachys solani]